MVDLSAIAAVANSLKVAGDLAKAAIGLRDAEMLRGTVIEMQGEISSALGGALSAQMDQLALLERIRALESQIAGLEAWEAKKQRYELHQWQLGSFSYRLKDGLQPPEVTHHLCATCFDQGRPSILQTGTGDLYRKALRCDRCSANIGTEPTGFTGSPYTARSTLR